tara:strand:+ start:326 stop:520 length:195 start_codon:yes stop_codon:yes gene_type:complete
VFEYKKTNRNYLNKKINNNIIKNKKIELKIIFLLSFEFGGFLNNIKVIIIAQNINNTDQPVIKA